MKYIKLYENFEPHDPYELMMIPQNKKAEMILREIYKDVPNLNLVSDLIVLGANLDWQDEDNSNRTPLHLAAEYGQVEIAQMLIDAGADVNAQDKFNRTPLLLAARDGQVEIARVLIGAGADLNVQDNRDETPLHLAARNGKLVIARVLIDAGARKNIRDNESKLPYDLAKTEEMKNLLRP